MKEYFTDLERAASKESAKAKRTTASGKSKRTAFSKKAAGNKKSKRGIAARAKPKPAKKSANKPTRRKGRR
jgi:hypothetical protein